jgi:hypothetical protein
LLDPAGRASPKEPILASAMSCRADGSRRRALTSARCCSLYSLFLSCGRHST